VALPGLIEPHMHLWSTVLFDTWTDCSPFANPTFESVVERLGRAAAAAPPGQWVRGKLFDPSLVEVRKGGRVRRLLFDTGVMPDGCVGNLRRLGKDPAGTAFRTMRRGLAGQPLHLDQGPGRGRPARPADPDPRRAPGLSQPAGPVGGTRPLSQRSASGPVKLFADMDVHRLDQPRGRDGGPAVRRALWVNR
jgi:hypothetical protein